MAKRNGKRNGKGRSPKGVVPPELAPYVIKPGEVRNPTGKNGRDDTTFARLVQMLGEDLTLTKQDGTVIRVTREHAALMMILNKCVKGPQHPTNDPDWRWAGQLIMDRICPIPRTSGFPEVERALFAEVRQADATVSVAFVERVREFAGRNDPGPDDVLKFLDQQMDDADNG